MPPHLDEHGPERPPGISLCRPSLLPPARLTALPTGTQHTETIYGVTSLSPAQASPARVLPLIRNHWTIENRLHWVREVTFDEDRCRIRRGRGRA